MWVEFKQLELKLTLNKSIVLPIHFQSVIQGMIYSFFKEWEFIHKKGFVSEDGKIYRLFTFAVATPLRKTGQRFYGQEGNSLRIIFSTPIEEIYKKISIGILNNNNFRINNNEIIGVETSFLPAINLSKKVVVKTLSSITAGYTKNNKTVYISHKDNEYMSFIENNARKKWETFYKQDCKFKLQITPIAAHKRVSFLNFGYRYAVNGYVGVFNISSDNEEFLTFSLLSGLGYKNSQGFGCVEVVEVML